jgi:hypothetical protein
MVGRSPADSRVRLVPPTDDPIMVEWHAKLVSRSVEPCHHPDEFVG